MGLVRTSILRASDVACVAAALFVAGCGEGAPAERVLLAQSALGVPTCVTIGRGLAGNITDARLRADFSGANFGADPSFVVGNQFTQRVSLVGFDLSPIPAGANVTHASLTVHELSEIGPSTVEAHRVTAPWAEANVSWASFAGAYDPAVVTSFSTAGAGATLHVDVTALAQAWTTGAPNHGVALVASGTNNSTYASSEAANPALRPTLDVCYTTPSCTDGVQNQGESGVDCGGPCAPCDRCAGVTCAAGDGCHGAGVCDPATGQCFAPVLPDGTACEDGDLCTQRDACASGVCAGLRIACIAEGSGTAAGAIIDAPIAALDPALAALLSVVEAAPGTAAPTAPGVVLLGPTLELMPHGVSFASPVTIAVPFTQVPGASPTLYTSDGVGPFQPVPNAVVKGSVMQAQVTHFSQFVVGTSTVDTDGDGFSPAQGDCDDNDFSAHPGAPEMCDGRDNNCDGIIDAGLWGFRVSTSLSRAHVALDAGGNTFVAGALGTTTDFGGAPLSPAGAWDIVVAKLNPSGQHLWSKRFGDAANQYATQLVVDASGNVIVTGVLQGTVDFGGGPLTSAASAIFLAKLDPGGHHIFSRILGPQSDAALNDIAVAPNGDVLVTGAFQGSIDLGGGPLGAPGGNVFVARLDPIGGHIWSKPLGSPAYDYPLGLTTSPAGDVYVAAMGGPLGGPNLTRLTAQGTQVWSRGLSTNVQSMGGSGVFLAPDGAGGVHVVAPDVSAQAENDGYNAAYTLTRFDAAGSQIASNTLTASGNYVVSVDGVTPRAGGGLVVSLQAAFGNQSTEEIDVSGNVSRVYGFSMSAAEDASGNVVLYDGGGVAMVGMEACVTCPNWFRDADGDGHGATGDWAQACVQPPGYVAHGGDCDDGNASVHPGAMERCDGADDDCDGHVDEGGVSWRHDFGPSTSRPHVATDASGHVVMVGLLKGTSDFGGGPVTSAGAQGDPYWLEVDAAGAHVQSRAFASSGVAFSPFVAIDGAGHRILADASVGTSTVDFGGGPITSMWGLRLAKLDATGHHVWSKTLASGPNGGVFLEDMTVDAAGNILAVGEYSGTVDFGNGPLAAPGAWKGYVVKLDGLGNLLWVRSIASGSTLGYRIAADAAGSIVVAGAFVGSVDIGGGPLVGPPGQTRTFMGKLDAAGNHVWSRLLGDTQHAPVPVVTSAGHIVIAGEFRIPLDLGGGPLTADPSQGVHAYVAELDGAGNHVWSRTVALWTVTGVVRDGAGNIAVAGAASANGASPQSVRVVRLDASGSLLWTHDLGTAATTMDSYSLASDGADTLVSADLYAFYDHAGSQAVNVGSVGSTLTRLAPACFP